MNHSPVFMLLTLTMVAVVMSSCGSSEGAKAHPPGESGPVSPPVSVSQSPQTDELVRLARATTSAAQEQLRGVLLDRGQLAKLNSEQEYLALEPRQLQVFFVLRALAENDSEPARQTLDAVANDAIYHFAGAFQSVLLEASKSSARPPAGLLQLWEEQLRPDADSLNEAVEAVVSNGSVPAIALFERSLLEQPYREDYVIAWLRGPVLRHRQDEALLRASQRLIGSSEWSKAYKRTLVAVLFEYDPARWYHSETVPPTPPDRSNLSDTSRELLLAIADEAATAGLLSSQRHAEVRKELARP